MNEILVDKVDKYLRESGNFLTSKEIEIALGKYYNYRAMSIQIWNALRALIGMGKVKRYGSGNNVRYKTTCMQNQKD